MRNIHDLLKRFSNSLNQDSELKDVVIEIIRDKTNITLKPESISLKNGVLEITSSPIVKSEINLREESLKTELRDVRKLPITRILYK